MPYKPSRQTEIILARAWRWIQTVAYMVTARWVFYRLLQDGTYGGKEGYRHLLPILSKARKEFYGPWRPWTLADDTRAPLLMQRQGFYTVSLRGWGFKNEIEWRSKLRKELNCPLDRWVDQPAYTEIWFEAAAMQGQFVYYANENIPLLAFHGDVSIPEKWRTAERLAERWLRLRKPVHIFYYGDLDPKGLIIPESAWEDIELWTYSLIKAKDPTADGKCLEDLIFTRVGINEGQEDEFNIPENPERPGTYQWEALTDDQAAKLIAKANEPLNLPAFREFEREEKEIAKRFKRLLATR